MKVGWLRDQARRDKVAFAAGRFGGAEIWRIDFVSSLNLQRSQNTPCRAVAPLGVKAD